MTIRWLAPLALLLAIAAAPATAGDDPAVARLALFLDRFGLQSGVPDKATSARMRPYVSRGLDADLAVARVAQAEFVRDHPDEKPPWVEGSLFNSSAYEPYTAYTIDADPAAAGRPGADGDRRTLRVHYTDDSVSPAVTWHDEYTMVHEDGAWRLDDVAFRAGFGFGNHGTLRGNLGGEDLPAEAGESEAESGADSEAESGADSGP